MGLKVPSSNGFSFIYTVLNLSATMIEFQIFIRYYVEYIPQESILFALSYTMSFICIMEQGNKSIKMNCETTYHNQEIRQSKVVRQTSY